MRRREFVALVGGAAAAASWPSPLRAQQLAMPVVGFLSARSAEDTVRLVEAFRQGLAETGYVEDQSIVIEYRWASGVHDRLPALAAELVRRPVDILVATGGQSAALAAKAATATIPIVFAAGGDLVKAGLIESYNRPGGNLTGFDAVTTQLEAKRLGLLRELVPRAALIGSLRNTSHPQAKEQLADIQAAASQLGLQLHAFGADTIGELETAFKDMARQRISALALAASPFFDTHRDLLVALAARHAVPTIYHFRDFTAAGGLMSYGVDPADGYRQTGVYAGRILRGARPAELPVLRPTKFELVINLKTARALGLEVPNMMQLLADEVIE
jgi:putative ABC transport system substrate-binding protein